MSAHNASVRTVIDARLRDTHPLMSRPPLIIPCALLLTACFDPSPEPSSGTGESSGGSASSGPGTSAVTSNSGSGQMSAEGTSGGMSTTDPTQGQTTDQTTDQTTSGTTMSIDPDGTSTSEVTGSTGQIGGSSESTGGPPPCIPVGPAELGFIWIANSTQSTISRITTDAMVEEGRYLTRPDMSGSPSRTSVSLTGDVAVANRNGGLTKFYGDINDCVDLNGNGVIDTSAGAADIRAWGAEECMAWHTPMVYTSQRPVAWAAGVLNEVTCEYEDEMVWTSGVVNSATIEILRVNGETGVIADTIAILEIPPNFFGLYGGAVDSSGNFWASMLGNGSLVRVDGTTLDHQIWPMAAGGYGMTVGASGYVFTCANDVARFDPVTELWDVAPGVGGSGGCAEDGMGRLWLASSPLVAIDVNTLQVVETINLPNYVHGVSVDFADLIWGVTLDSDAYRIDPVTGTIDTFTGLVQSYTYSDMTGFALTAVTP